MCRVKHTHTWFGYRPGKRKKIAGGLRVQGKVFKIKFLLGRQLTKLTTGHEFIFINCISLLHNVYFLILKYIIIEYMSKLTGLTKCISHFGGDLGGDL